MRRSYSLPENMANLDFWTEVGIPSWNDDFPTDTSYYTDTDEESQLSDLVQPDPFWTPQNHRHHSLSGFSHPQAFFSDDEIIDRHVKLFPMEHIHFKLDDDLYNDICEEEISENSYESEEDEIVEISTSEFAKKILKKLELSAKPNFHLPRDLYTLNKTTSVLTEFFRFEIENRNHQLREIDDKIMKANELIEMLTENLLQKPPLENVEKLLLVKTVDQKIVYVFCPVCHAKNFLTSDSFLQHCQFEHHLEFRNFTDAVLSCSAQIDSKIDDFLLSTCIEVSLSISDIFKEENYGNNSLIFPKVERIDNCNYFNDDDPNALLKRIKTEEEESFFVTKEVVIGNYSDVIPLSHRHGQATHRWSVFVRGEDIDYYIDKVRFFLDDTIEQNIIEISSPPFQISHEGFHSFILRIQIFFKTFSDDNNNNLKKEKPLFVTLVHPLKLNPQDVSAQDTQNGLLIKSTETGFLFESARKIEIDKDLYENLQILKTKIEEKELLNRLPPASGFPPTMLQNQNFGKEPTSLQPLTKKIEEYLLDAVQFFPIISPETPPYIAYSIAPNREIWDEWNYGKKKAIERQRAYYIQKYLLNHYNVLGSISEIVIWCRLRNFMPPPISTKQYCKFCGCPHEPREMFSILESECEKRFDKMMKSWKVEKKAREEVSWELPQTISTKKFYETNLHKAGDIGAVWKVCPLQHSTSGNALALSGMMYQSLSQFIKSLTLQSLNVYFDQKNNFDLKNHDTEDENKMKLFVPMHIRAAIRKNESGNLDFLKDKSA